MRQAQPRGPYHIVAYSYGCAVTFEIALQLQVAGAVIGSLIFLDGAPKYVRLIAGYRRDLLDKGTNEQGTSILCSYMMQYIATDFSKFDALSSHHRHSGLYNRTTTNPANTATLTADEFPNLADLAGKRNAALPTCEAQNVVQ
ncbi:hypothetical protein MRX96_054890 [Rhipicephalus microplus]